MFLLCFYKTLCNALQGGWLALGRGRADKGIVLLLWCMWHCGQRKALSKRLETRQIYMADDGNDRD
jgi:hypothetical protein